ncbi:hypothetical protein FRB99_000927 [Tulasnella sp. 403]|nr:hypothetical protein FRB99_000927 [Tulasnella sp. 403]
MNFVAPASDDGRKYARAQQPWALEGFWEYLIRATIRGLSKGAIHFFQDLKNHPSAHVRHIAPMLTKVLESHPTSSQFATELEFFNAHRRWKDTVRPLRNELQLLDDSEEGDWREGLEDLVGVLEGDQDTVMRVCSEENGGYGWREVLGVWGVWVQVDFRRQDLPDTLAIINDSVQLDPSMIDEMAQAALVSQQLKRFIQLAADQDSWLGSHLADLMEKMNIILYPPSTVDGDDGDTEPEVSDTEGDTDEELVTLRDYLLMDYAGEILHGDPSSWHIELDYFAACGSVGRSRLGLILRRLAVEVDTESEANTEATHTAEQPILNGTMNNGIDVSGEGRPDGSSEDTSPTLGRLTGMQRVQKLVDVCKEYELWDEMESLCKQRRYGDAVAYCIYARDFKTIARIADLLLDEYITNGADEFISLVDSVPDVSDLLLESPTFHLGGSGSTPFRSRLMFLSQYAAFHKRYQDGRKKEAAKILTGMLNSEIVPRWWWGVILLDAAGMCEDEELWFEEEDAYDLLRHVEEIYIRAEQGCGSDYLEALEKIMQASQKNHPASSAGKREATKDDQSPIKQLEVYGIPLLLDRIKQSMVSCRELSTFFKKRAIVEDEYGRTLQKAARTAGETYAANDGKSGTYVTAWQSTMKLHEVIAENRLKFAAQLHQSVEDLANLAREVEKNRKTTKDLASRYERNLQESEEKLEKAKQRCDAAHDELEKLLIAKEGESLKEVGSHSRNGGPSSGKRAIGKAVAKGGMLLKGKNPTSMLKQEEEIRARLSSYSDAYGQAVQQTQAMRQEYFNFQLPRILRSLKECLDELDFGTQYHLSRYAYMFETAVLNDGSTLVPAGGIEDGPGMKPIAESIDSRGDFKTYMQNYALATGRPSGPRREGPVEDGFLPPLPKHIHANDHPLHSQASDTRQTASASTGSSQTLHNGTATNGTSGGTAPAGTGSAPTPSYPPAILAAMQQHPDRGRPTFGISLSEQMARDAVEVPKIVQKCCEAIEAYGLRTVGIYRLSGTTSRIQKLKVILDRDLDNVDLMADEWRMDVNNVTSVLKLWLRELPEPLLTFGLYQGYIDAAKAENERLRHIQLHHRVNDLPDANYATLKYLMGHLHKVRELETINSMTASNLSIVFGPTLLGPPPPSMAGDGSTSGGTTLQDMNWQCRAVETIIEHYTDIFVDEGEEA